jgi:dienelactone hydrolase
MLRLAAILLVAFPGAAQSLFDYDRTVPFEWQSEPLSPRKDVILTSAAFQTRKGRRMDSILVEPAGKASRKRPAILFQHGGGQSMATYIGDAILLAKAGAVSLILEAPYRLTPEEQKQSPPKGASQRDRLVDIVVAVRRSIDWLESRPDIDRNRIAYVGHSFGGNAGGVLTAVDKRIKAFVLMGLTDRYTTHIEKNPGDFWKTYRDSMSKEELTETLELIRVTDPDQFLPRSAPAQLLFQCARFDMDDVKQACELAYQAAAQPKQLRWYEIEHNFANVEASLDRLVWLRERLRLRGLAQTLGRMAR